MPTATLPRRHSKPYAEKSYGDLKIKADSNTRKVSGYLAVFGNKDSDDDIIVKGAFAKSIQERGPESNAHNKIAFCWQHDIKDPIGRFTVLKEDDYGLYFEADMDRVPNGDRALMQLTSGTLDQFSIGINYIWDKMEYDPVLDAYILKEVVLFEGSVVTLGANGLTYFAGMKSEQIESEVNKLNRDTERTLKSLPFEAQVEIRQLIAKHISLAEAQPVKPLKSGEPNQSGIDFSKLSNLLK